MDNKDEMLMSDNEHLTVDEQVELVEAIEGAIDITDSEDDYVGE